MDFYSVRDLRTETKKMFDTLSKGEEIVITNNGKPAALMLDISGENFEIMIQAIRQAKAMIAFNNMRSRAAQCSYMTEEDIEIEINAARRGM